MVEGSGSSGIVTSEFGGLGFLGLGALGVGARVYHIVPGQ